MPCNNLINKKLSLLPLLFIFFFSIFDCTTVQAQGGAEGEVPKRLERKFRRDAARLALRLEAEKEDLRYLSISIPQENVQMIFSMLSKIYLEDETAKSIAKCNIHTFPNPSIDQFVIIYERDIEWAEPLLDGINETDSDEFNDLLDEYELIIDKHVSWNDTQDAITIRSKEPMNMAALSNEFYNIEGVEEIDFGVPKVVGNDIVLNRIATGWQIQYLLRFGAFGSGGGKRHVWTYEASDDGAIKFIEEEGEPIPLWMRCSKDKERSLAYSWE